MNNKENGFTLLEVLLVLSILGVMLLIVIPLNTLVLENEKEKQFIREFSSDMLFMQSYSRSILAQIRYSYDPEKHKYTIYKDFGKPLVEKYLPNGWDIKMRSFNNVQFNHHGSISELGTMILNTNRHTYKFIFSLGKGRFRIEKE